MDWNVVDNGNFHVVTYPAVVAVSSSTG
jgi:hypothetical protein